jgi:hypothetical protein
MFIAISGQKSLKIGQKCVSNKRRLEKSSFGPQIGKNISFLIK